MSKPVGITACALTLEDFRAATDKASELRYADAAWPVYKTYELKGEGEGTYFRAEPFFLMGDPNREENRVYAANVDDGSEKGEQSPAVIMGRLSSRWPGFHSRDANEELRVARDVLFKTGMNIGGKEERALQEWFRNDYEGIPELEKVYLREAIREVSEDFDELGVELAQWLAGVGSDAARAYREGGQERLFGNLRQGLKGFDNAKIERLLKAMGADLDRGMDIADALKWLVFVQENGVVTPGPEAEKVLLDRKQNSIRVIKPTLDENIRRRREGFRKLYPLSLPGLFLEFAELARAEITEDVVKDWVHRYGVLGLGMEDLSGSWHPANRGTPRETVAAFAREAREARWTRELYEAKLYLDSADDELVKTGIRETRRLFGWPEHHEPSEQECRDKALDAIELQVQDRLGNHCVTRFRRAGNGLVDFLEYRTLLGAMYLQFAWVLREGAAIRRCKWCGERFEIEPASRQHRGESENRTRKTHKNKEFCGPTCRIDYNNDKKKRQKRQEADAEPSAPTEADERIRRLAAKRGMEIDDLLQEMLGVYEDHSQGG